MNEQENNPLRARALQALVVFLGAALFGPALPALVLTAMAEAGALLAGAHTRPILSIPATASDAYSFTLADGGGATAMISGLALALVLLWRGRLRPAIVTRIVAFVAALVSLWIVRAAPLRGAVSLTFAFVVAAVVTARALYRLALSSRLLPEW